MRHTRFVSSSNPPQGSTPGYWSSPAYWHSGSNYNLYYGVDEKILTNTPWPIYLYQLQTTGSPISSNGPSAQTTTKFCGNPHAPTPSISANGSTGGLLWAVESSNSGNPSNCLAKNIGPAVLHAYDATSLSSKYASPTTLQTTTIGNAVNFPVPTIFNGKVYMGTITVPNSGTNVDVFGLCSSQSGGCMQ